MIYFTADEHYGHRNIIKYCIRPFNDVDEMDRVIIARHNKLVGQDDTVYHLGDFTLVPDPKAVESKYVSKLNGKHVFLIGSHDHWLDEETHRRMLDIKLRGQKITLCHYLMQSWHCSHHGSWQLFGHHHGHFNGLKNQYDVGVDNNDFYPVSIEEIERLFLGDRK